MDEIYDHASILAPTPDIKDMLARELAAELMLSRPTLRGQVLWKEAREAGKSIVVTTDMYLPRSFLESLLLKAGYKGWSAIYASGDDGTAKYDGTTYAHILADFPGRRVLHVGDNKRADVLAAEAAGLDARHLPRPLEGVVRQPNRVELRIKDYLRRTPDDLTHLQQSVIESLTETWLGSTLKPRTDLERIGYRVLGPALLGFTQYLEQEARARSISRLVFLAREGALLKCAFERYTMTYIETHYAIISTRVLGAARLSSPLTSEDLRFLTKSPVPIQARQYLTRILGDLVPKGLDQLLLDNGVSPEARLSADTAAIRLRHIFELLLPELMRLSTSQRDAAASYISALGVVTPSTAIVDVGWQGTIQSAMAELVGAPLTGLYWGLRDTPLTNADAGLNAWVDQRRGGADGRLFAPLFRFTPAFEVLLANPTAGSAATVQQRGTIRSINDAYTFGYLPLEFSASDQVAIKTMQSQALAFIDDFTALRDTLDDGALKLTRGVAHSELVRLLSKPSFGQLKALQGITFDGTYGASPQRLGHWWVPPDFRRGR